MSSEASSSAVMQVEIQDRLAIVSLNRPDSLNAVNMLLLEQLISTFDALNDRSDIWCAILKGNGRAFCVGADTKERPTMSLDAVRRRRRIAPLAFGAMRRFSRPVIAQVHGFAIGSGLEMALNCDLIVASDETTMGLIETRRASIPAGGGTQLLPRLIGTLRARELIYTGRKFSANEAMQWGMLNYVVPRDQLENKTMELAREITAAAPIACAQAKRAIDGGLDMALASGIQLEAALYERILTSRDRAEVLQAGREGRTPVFRGE